MKSLLVTADDFGLSPAVDAGILAAFAGGIVRSTALMTGFPELPASAARLRAHPALEVGLHLTLTCGRPVSDPRRVPSLVDRDGSFHSLRGFVARAAARRIAWREVRLEWLAQLERGRREGLRFAFLNTHHHVHMLPAAASLVAALGRDHDVPGVRLTRFAGRAGRTGKGRALRALAGAAGRAFARARLAHPDGALELADTADAAAALAALGRELDALRPGAYELVCHPGETDALLAERDVYVEARRRELALLTDPACPALLAERGVALTTFGRLDGMAPLLARASRRVLAWPHPTS